MQVLKFGGTSLSNAENIHRVIAIVKQAMEKDRTAVVVSAPSNITDLLLGAGTCAAERNEIYKEKLTLIEQTYFGLIRELIPVLKQSQLLSLVKKSCNEMEDICSGIFLLGEITPRSKDRLAAYGEWLSSHVITEALNAAGIEKITCKDARELITTDAAFTHAVVDFKATNRQIQDFFSSTASPLCVVPGFIAADISGVTTTLGRGGSDYTAAIIAAALGAVSLEIWTDVNGMMTANPMLVSNAQTISRISYQEAMELSHFGAKVIYPPTIQPVMNKRIPVWVKNTFAPLEEGTLIKSSVAQKNRNTITGLSCVNNVALISLEGSGMIGVPGFSKRLFEVLSDEKINVILITQSSSEHAICVAIDAAMVDQAKLAIDSTFANEIALKKVKPLQVERALSIIALVGDNMRNLPGISGRMFSAMGKNGINIRAIAQGASEKNISAVISVADVQKAANVLHEEFFETVHKQVNLFIVGTGNVGFKLLGQFEQQRHFLQQRLRLNLRVVGICNSRKMLIDSKGINLEKWEEYLNVATTAKLEDFVKNAIEKNLRNAVFVDVTANGKVADVYSQLLQKSISVVACNKIAASSAYPVYKELKHLAGKYNCRFLFETNVGAGLPVIATLNDLINSGDRIHRIEAVLSGTLNFVFNHYDGSRKFSEVVRQAQEEGYTEPDPRLDLNGTDVARKIMILARETGKKIELKDVDNQSFLPESCMKGSVADFYNEIAREENHFKQLVKEANEAGCKLKFVASYTKGKASVRLQHIDPNHDFYHLYGKDNVVLFYTDRYKEQPLVVKGAGAGAEVTASGVFADIMRAVE